MDRKAIALNAVRTSFRLEVAFYAAISRRTNPRTIMLILAIMIFGFPAMIVAEKKGFAESRWLLTFGIVGLIVVCCLPSARSRRISHEEARRRRQNANDLGAILCALNAAIFVLGCLIVVFAHSANR